MAHRSHAVETTTSLWLGLSHSSTDYPMSYPVSSHARCCQVDCLEHRWIEARLLQQPSVRHYRSQSAAAPESAELSRTYRLQCAVYFKCDGTQKESELVADPPTCRVQDRSCDIQNSAQRLPSLPCRSSVLSPACAGSAIIIKTAASGTYC